MLRLRAGTPKRQGALKNKLLNDAYREFMNDKNNLKNLKKYLKLANSSLGSLSFIPGVGKLFEALKEFKDFAEHGLDFNLYSIKDFCS